MPPLTRRDTVFQLSLPELLGNRYKASIMEQGSLWDIAWLLLQTVTWCESINALSKQVYASSANWRAKSTNTYLHKCEFRLVTKCLAVLVLARHTCNRVCKNRWSTHEAYLLAQCKPT